MDRIEQVCDMVVAQNYKCYNRENCRIGICINTNIHSIAVISKIYSRCLLYLGLFERHTMNATTDSISATTIGTTIAATSSLFSLTLVGLDVSEEGA